MVDSNSGSSFSPSTLLCHENLNNDEEDEDEDDDELNQYTSGPLQHGDDDDEQEYLRILFRKEIRGFELDSRLQCSIRTSIQSARSDSIQWILNMRALLGFRLQTAYLSVIYFDRFLSRRMIDNEKHWAVRLLTVACLSLAAKMEECKAPALSEFRSEEYNFESKVIQRMEILVLTTLEWRMVSVTPFDYLRYFVSKLCLQKSLQRNVVSRIIDLIFANAKDINLLGHRSSTIAVAATLVSMDLHLTRQSLEIKMNDIIPINRFIELEDVHSCYSELREKFDRSSSSVMSPELSPGGRTVFGVPVPSSSVNTKRKRLTFSDCDQDIGLSKTKQHRKS